MSVWCAAGDQFILQSADADLVLRVQSVEGDSARCTMRSADVEGEQPVVLRLVIERSQ